MASVAYIRFASVYRDFSEARDFEEFAGTVRDVACHCAADRDAGAANRALDRPPDPQCLDAAREGGAHAGQRKDRKSHQQHPAPAQRVR